MFSEGVSSTDSVPVCLFCFSFLILGRFHIKANSNQIYLPHPDVPPMSLFLIFRCPPCLPSQAAPLSLSPFRYHSPYSWSLAAAISLGPWTSDCPWPGQHYTWLSEYLGMVVGTPACGEITWWYISWYVVRVDSDENSGLWLLSPVAGNETFVCSPMSSRSNLSFTGFAGYPWGSARVVSFTPLLQVCVLAISWKAVYRCCFIGLFACVLNCIREEDLVTSRSYSNNDCLPLWSCFLLLAPEIFCLTFLCKVMTDFKIFFPFFSCCIWK